MSIVKILEDKTQKIMNGQDYVGLTGEEMNILCDPEQLRAFKLYVNLPVDYQKAENLNECVAKIRAGDSLYRTLEYCVIANRALRMILQYINFEGVRVC